MMTCLTSEIFSALTKVFCFFDEADNHNRTECYALSDDCQAYQISTSYFDFAGKKFPLS